MRRRSRRPARGAAGALVCLLLVAGCYYLRYDALVRTHVDLMIALAEKRHDLHAAETPPRHLAEFRYPLERARDFARIVGGRFGERDSFRRFTEFLDAYEAGLGVEEREELAKSLVELRRHREAVFAALDQE